MCCGEETLVSLCACVSVSVSDYLFAAFDIWQQETPGEDPLLSGLVGKYYTLAGQGGVAALNWSAPPQGPPMKTAWSIKHYLAYDVECSSGGAGAHFALTAVDNGSPAAGMGFDCQAPGVDRFHMNANLTEPDLVDCTMHAQPIRRVVAIGD